jgi:cob(I)alamin adenosyltransferase
MGELASEDKDKDRYVTVFGSLTDEDLALIDQEIARLEGMEVLKQKDWVLYGNSLIGSRCDFASKVCRRAERSVIDLKENSEKTRPLLLQYINRLSDMLHLYGRLFDYREKQ